MEDRAGITRIYRKSWCHDNLFGSLRHEATPLQRAVWNDLLDLAKLSRVRAGLIAANKDVPYSDAWLAAFLNYPIDEFKEALAFLAMTKRIANNGHGIEIMNWSKYQSEYDRQKPYRNGKKGKLGHLPDGEEK
jgi:hypothetical protein